MIDILGMSGSLRTDSYNTALLRAARDLATSDRRLILWPDLATIPPFNEDHENEPDAAVAAMCTAVQQSDAVLIATPEYNTTIPGQLKNALDWLSRPTGEGPLAGKPAAVIGASQSAYGAKWSQQAVRQVLHACGTTLVGDPLYVARCDTAFTADQRLRDHTQRSALVRILTQLGDAARDAADRTTSLANTH